MKWQQIDQRLSILRRRSLGGWTTAPTDERIRITADPTKTRDKQYKIKKRAVASKNRHFSEITRNIDSAAVRKGVEKAFAMAKNTPLSKTFLNCLSQVRNEKILSRNTSQHSTLTVEMLPGPAPREELSRLINIRVKVNEGPRTTEEMTSILNLFKNSKCAWSDKLKIELLKNN